MLSVNKFSQVSEFASHLHISVQDRLCFLQEQDDVVHLLVPQPHFTNFSMAAGTGDKSEVTGA